MTPKPRSELTAAWARVRIHLNLGEVEEATHLTASLVAGMRWPTQQAVRLGRADIFGLADMPVGWCWLDLEQMIAILNWDVRDDYAHATCLYDFVDAIEHIPASGFLRYDVANWAELEQMEADDAAD